MKGYIITSVFPKVIKELDLAVEKHGLQANIDPFKQLSIAIEELGETAQDINDGNYEDAMKECYQTIAMACKLVWVLENHLK